MTDHSSIISTVSQYYAATVATHGATPRGVDWNSEESQYVRFAQLSKIFELENAPCSLLDFGAGWGAFLDYINAQYPERTFHFTGYDIVPEMLKHAHERHQGKGTWISSIPEDTCFDYVVASGVFNVRQGHSDAEWERYIEATLRQLHSMSVKGFAFNMLTSYSDKDKMREYLYYADPCKTFDFCKREFSNSVAVLHDYPLYEFTILVRK